MFLGPIRCSLSSKRAACEMYSLPLTFFALKTPKTVDRRRRWDAPGASPARPAEETSWSVDKQQGEGMWTKLQLRISAGM
jgi:hypothetical protein